MDKVEPERLIRSIPLFKSRISGTAWDQWSDAALITKSGQTFTSLISASLGSADSKDSSHNRMEENVQGDENGEGARVLEMRRE